MHYYPINGLKIKTIVLQQASHTDIISSKKNLDGGTVVYTLDTFSNSRDKK